MLHRTLNFSKKYRLGPHLLGMLPIHWVPCHMLQGSTYIIYMKVKLKEVGLS